MDLKTLTVIKDLHHAVHSVSFCVKPMLGKLYGLYNCLLFFTNDKSSFSYRCWIWTWNLLLKFWTVTCGSWLTQKISSLLSLWSVTHFLCLYAHHILLYRPISASDMFSIVHCFHLQENRFCEVINLLLLLMVFIVCSRTPKTRENFPSLEKGRECWNSSGETTFMARVRKCIRHICYIIEGH